MLEDAKGLEEVENGSSETNDSEYKRRVLLMGRACSGVRRLYARSLPHPDVDPNYETIQEWPFITNSYHGIEQSLKLLLHDKLDVPLEDPNKKIRSFGHDLLRAFRALDNASKKHIELHFRQHRSLHSYPSEGVDTSTALEFIRHINSTKLGSGKGKPKGESTWRYILLEGVEHVPQTYTWSMMEIWDAICCIFRNDIRRYRLNLGSDCNPVSERLARQFYTELFSYRHALNPRIEAELCAQSEWLAKYDCHLNASMDLLNHILQGTSLLSDLPSPIERKLRMKATNMLYRIENENIDVEHAPNNVDERALLVHLNRGNRIKWNPSHNRFETISAPNGRD